MSDSGIRALSSIFIDTDKDWNAKKIENLGAPDSNDDVPRRDTIVPLVEAAGLALADGKSIKIEETLGTDHTWSGITTDGVAGEDLVLGEVCYLKSDGKYWKADADAASTMPVVAIATEDISADGSGVFLLRGYFRDDTWNWTKGGLLYASTTAGDLTQTAPSGSGDQVQVAGIALTADIIHFDPSPVLVEIA